MTQATPSRGVLADDDCVAPGTNRLDMLRTYFEICGAAGVVLTVGMIVATLWFPDMQVTRGNHPLLPIAAAGMFTWGTIQTSRMLRKRRRVGAWAAAMAFAASLAVTRSPGAALAAVAVNSIGLVMLISVWKHLD